MRMKSALVALAAWVPVIAFAQTVAEMYPAPWVNADNPSITRALSEAGVSGCGKYRYRVSSSSKSELLVYCSRSAKVKDAYMVWPNINKVMGPYPPDPLTP